MSGIDDYTRREAFGLLSVYFINGFYIGFILYIVLWEITHAVLCNSCSLRNHLVLVVRLEKLAESIMSLHTRLLRPSSNFRSFLQ
jgi:hypothetical protein